MSVILVAGMVALTIPAAPSLNASEGPSVITTITGANRPYAIAVTPDGTRAYIANAASNSVSVLNTASNTISQTITAGIGSGPAGVAMSPDGSRVYVSGNSSNNVTVIDPASNTVTATIPVGPAPEGIAVSPDGSRVYTANGGDSVSEIDTATNTVTNTIAVSGIPATLALSPNGGTLYVTQLTGDTVAVINTATATQTATIPVGRAPYSVAVSPSGATLYVTPSANDAVNIVGGSPLSVLNSVSVGDRPQGLALSPDGQWLIAANYTGDSVSVIHLSDLTVTTLAVGDRPTNVAFHPNGTTAYVTNELSNTISVISVPSDPVSSSVTEFTFLLPDGRECSSISPMRVEVGAMVMLPGVDALCRTMPGATVHGWTIPVPPGFTGYGSEASPFPPGLPVLVTDSQRFTVVPFEPILTMHYDANVAATDTCTSNGLAHSRGRIADVWVPRTDVAVARFPTAAACTPPGHTLRGWNTRGDGTGTEYSPGDALPAAWGTASTNERTLYAAWRNR